MAARERLYPLWRPNPWDDPQIFIPGHPGRGTSPLLHPPEGLGHHGHQRIGMGRRGRTHKALPFYGLTVRFPLPNQTL